MTDAHPAGAVLVVAVWAEDGELRGRLTAADDLGAPARTAGAAHGLEDLTRAVREWLRARTGEIASDPGGGAVPSA